MNKSTTTSPRRIQTLLLCTATAIWMSSTACNALRPKLVVISADQTETFLKSNQVFHANIDGVFMPLAKYQRYRRAVADRIEELQK
jgi:hypothetical protein